MKRFVCFLACIVAFSAYASAGVSPTGKVALGYVLKAEIDSNSTPADATTYFVGGLSGLSIANRTTYANVALTIPKSGTITRIDYLEINQSVTATNEAVTLFVRKNDTTNTNLSTTETWNQTANTSKGASFTGLSIAVATGDTIAVGITTPTWATNPTGMQFVANMYIE